MKDIDPTDFAQIEEIEPADWGMPPVENKEDEIYFVHRKIRKVLFMVGIFNKSEMSYRGTYSNVIESDYLFSKSPSGENAVPADSIVPELFQFVE